MAYNGARTGLEGHLNSPEIGYAQLLSPQSTTCLHQQCDLGLHVYTDGVTQVRTTRLHQWCDSGLYIYTNGVTQDYMFISTELHFDVQSFDFGAFWISG